MNNHLTIENCPFGFMRAKFDVGSIFKYRYSESFPYSGSRLCHYTNLNGLVGILSSGGFWVSDFRFLNDTEEYFNGCQMAKNVIAAAISRKRPRDPIFVSILEAVILHLDRSPKKTFFVCSFTEEDDSLEQWRAYANGSDGICIIFHNKPPFVSSHFSTPPVMLPYKVIYDDTLKRKFLIGVIAKYAIELRKDLIKGYEVDVEEWSRELAQALSMDFIIFKNKSFASEKEVRLIIAEEQLTHFAKLQHRIANGRIIPYVNSSYLYNDSFVENCGDRLPISAIRVGPTANQEITIQSVKTFLSNMGYDDVPVISSAVPFRG